MSNNYHLSRYGHHDDVCPLHHEANLPGDAKCTCGFSAALIETPPVTPKLNLDDYYGFWAWYRDCVELVDADGNEFKLRQCPNCGAAMSMNPAL